MIRFAFGDVQNIRCSSAVGDAEGNRLFGFLGPLRIDVIVEPKFSAIPTARLSTAELGHKLFFRALAENEP